MRFESKPGKSYETYETTSTSTTFGPSLSRCPSPGAMPTFAQAVAAAQAKAKAPLMRAMSTEEVAGEVEMTSFSSGLIDAGRGSPKQPGEARARAYHILSYPIIISIIA